MPPPKVYDGTGGYVELESGPLASAVGTLQARIEQLIPVLRDGLRTFQTDLVAARWQTVYVGLRIVLALARLHTQRTDDDE